MGSIVKVVFDRDAKYSVIRSINDYNDYLERIRFNIQDLLDGKSGATNTVGQWRLKFYNKLKNITWSKLVKEFSCYPDYTEETFRDIITTILDDMRFDADIDNDAKLLEQPIIIIGEKAYDE